MQADDNCGRNRNPSVQTNPRQQNRAERDQPAFGPKDNAKEDASTFSLGSRNRIIDA